ncbi:MAG: HlyC/CorC family transporter [Candidatus Riflebacteria bacterium]|nr:HlyC/CorC family transporter [Candidatus Riflebacteria bacterium]
MVTVLLVSAGLLAALLFAGAEEALLALSEDPEVRERTWLPERLEALLARPPRLLASLVAGNLAAVALAGTALTLELTDKCGESWGSVLAVLILAPLVALVNEIVPRGYVRPHAQGFLLATGAPLAVLARLTRPLAVAGETLAVWLHFALDRTFPPRDFPAQTSARTTAAARPQAREDLLESVLEFSETLVKEVMVPRRDMIALPCEADLRAAVSVVRDTQYSRIPIYRGKPENVVGVIHSKDLLAWAREPRAAAPTLMAIARQPLYVPGVMTLDDLLAQFQLGGTHMAFVVDEFGSTAGLITLEDVIEEIFGEIQDEHDREEQPIRRTGRASWLVDGTASVDDVEKALRVELPESECETLGGLVFLTLGHLPETGETCQLGSVQCKVLRVENHRIRELNVTLTVRQRSRPAASAS